MPSTGTVFIRKVAHTYQHICLTLYCPLCEDQWKAWQASIFRTGHSYFHNFITTCISISTLCNLLLLLHWQKSLISQLPNPMDSLNFLIGFSAFFDYCLHLFLLKTLLCSTFQDNAVSPSSSPTNRTVHLPVLFLSFHLLGCCCFSGLRPGLSLFSPTQSCLFSWP